MATYTNIHNPGGFTSLEDTCILETHSMIRVEPVEALAGTPDEASSQSKVGQTKRESERHSWTAALWQPSTFCGMEQTAPRARPWRTLVPQV
jgi:hypothetical protein